MQKKNLKKLVPGLFIILTYMVTGTIPASAQINKKLKIELGEKFKNDQVKVFLDKELVYENRISTPDSLIIADLFYVPKPRMPYTIMVEINGKKYAQSSPKKPKELGKEDYSLVINYNRETDEVDLKTQTLVFLFD